MTASFFEYLGWVSLSPNLTESFEKILQDAEQRRHPQVEIEHLLLALVDDPEGAIALSAMDVDRDELRDDVIDRLEDIAAGSRVTSSDLHPSRELKKLMARASDLADKDDDNHLDGGDVVRALAKFETAGHPGLLKPLQKRKVATSKTPRKSRSTPHNPAQPEPIAPQSGDSQVERTPISSKSDQFNIEADPIRASIKSIMARRRDAEEILYECEWYHLFKSLNMIDEALDDEEQKHRAKLLAKAEQELAERPRCRKAFLYVRHLDQELARLKGIVDIDWVGDLTPDETVARFDRMRNAHYGDIPTQTANSDRGLSDIGEHLFDVRVQESEVRALEQKLMRLDRTAGTREDRIKALETDIERHDTHSKKRENVIGELERYLRSEMDLADARDQLISDLESQLSQTKSLSDTQVSKASNLEQELAAVKEHAGNREMRIADLEAKLKIEKDSATSHAGQVSDLRAMLVKEKERAEDHDTQIKELNEVLGKEKERAKTHEQQSRALETDLQKRLEQLQTREIEIKNLQENLKSQEGRITAREEQMKKLETDLASYESKGFAHKKEIEGLEAKLRGKEQEAEQHLGENQKLLSSIEAQQGDNQVHQQEINALKAQLLNLENKMRDQDAAFTVEKGQLTQTIETMRQKLDEVDGLVEIIRVDGEPYRINSEVPYSNNTAPQIISRRTIPVASRRKS